MAIPRTFAPTLLVMLLVSPIFAAKPSSSPSTSLTGVTVEIHGLRRHYILFVPESVEPAKPAPLVMMLHGFGGTAAAASKHYGWCELAEKEKFIAVFPEATRFNMTRAPSFDNNPPLWNDGSGRGFAGWTKADDIGYLQTVLADVSRRCNVDPDRVYCTGFSNGASMTWRAGVELADVFAAIAPVSGHLWFTDAKLSRKVPALFLFGDSDPINPIEGGNAATPYGLVDQKPPLRRSYEIWLNALGLEAKPSVLRDEPDIHAERFGTENGLEINVYTIHHLGHEWPGHGRVLPKTMTGESSNALDATAVIWDFFKSHPRTKP